MKRKKNFWNKLKNRYKLTIFNESTYEEVMHFRLSPLHVFMALSTLAVVLITLTIILIAFTNLREFIPGYPDRAMRRQITLNALRVDSLMVELNKKDQFFQSIRMVMTGEDGDTTARVTTSVEKINHDTIVMGTTPEENGFREMIEEKERFNLSLGQISSSPDDFYHFFPPLQGIVTNHFDEAKRHFGIDLVTKQNTNVASVLDGVVVFADWTVETGFVLAIQHSSNLVSIYKHNSVLLKRQGDFVRAGEVISIVGNTGEETTGLHLHLELWKAGKPINPENYIKFK